MKVAENARKGITMPLNSKEREMSAVQAAWRFYNNANVDVQELFGMVESQSKEAIQKIRGDYVPIAHDWSWLDYRGHHAKEDLIKRNNRSHAKSVGYDLQSSLLIDPNNGVPLAPVALNLKTARKIHSTYREDLKPELSHLEELAKRCVYLQSVIKDKKPVHIVDREADSVLFMRRLQEEDALFIIRVKNNAGVYWNDKKREIRQKELAEELGFGREVGWVKYHKKRARLFVSECDVTLTRPHHQRVIDEDGKRKSLRIPGEPVEARFIVSRVVDAQNNILATWMLMSNLSHEVSAQTISRWYYYRWNIESYFKLLKTTGFNLEKWQQEKPEALFKRLLVVSYAVVLVYKLANDDTEEGRKVRAFLVKLSGKLMEYKTEYTLPALLTGLWVFLRMMDMLQHFSIDELYHLRNQVQDIMGFGLFEVGNV